MLEVIEGSIADALRRGRLDEAATVGLRGYGPEILGFLVALGPGFAEDAFSQFCEDLWRGLPAFRGNSSFRTWAYTLARHAGLRVRRDPYTKRRTSIEALGPISEVAAELRATTASFLAARVRDGVAKLREELSEEDRALLVLRVDREMAWADIARVFEGDEASPDALARRSAALRKRFERLKQEIRTRAEQEGLVQRRSGKRPPS